MKGLNNIFGIKCRLLGYNTVGYRPI